MASATLQEQAYLEALGFSESTSSSTEPDYGTTTFTVPPAEPKFNYDQSAFRAGVVDEIQLLGYYPPTRETRNLSEYVSTITWTEAEGQAGIMGELDFFDPALPGALLDYEQKKSVQNFIAQAGLIFVFSTRANGNPFKERQRWINWNPTVGAPLSDTVQFYDNLVYLANGQCSVGYQNMTASEIAAGICAEFNIPVASLVKASYKIPYFLFTGSIYDAIATAYAFERHQTGKYFYITVDRGKLVVRRTRSILHDSKDVFLLDPESNVRGPMTFSRSLDQYAGGVIPTGTDQAGDAQYINVGTIDPNSETTVTGAGAGSTLSGSGSGANLAKAKLTVKGVAATTAQRKIGAQLLAIGSGKNAPLNAMIAAIYAAIWESTMSESRGNGSHVGVLSGAVADFAYNDTAGEADAFFDGGFGYGNQTSQGAIYFSNQGQSVVQIAISTEKGGPYSGESGYPGDAQAVAEARAWVESYLATATTKTTSAKVVSPQSATTTKVPGLTKKQVAAASTGGQDSINAAEQKNQLAASVLFGALVVNRKIGSIRDPAYTAKAAQLLSNRLARAAKELDLTVDGNVLLRQGDRVHLIGYPLDLFVSSITQTISRGDHSMQLALAWREFDVSDQEDYHAVQEAGAQYLQLQKQEKTGKSSKGISSDKLDGKTITTPKGGYKDIQQWAPALLSALGAPNTAANVDSLVAWWGKEGGAGRQWGTNNLADYNPYNTTEPVGNSGVTGSQGDIAVYRSWADGIIGTVKTLRNGLYNDILANLNKGIGLKSGAAVGLKTWSTGKPNGVGGYSSV